MSDNPDKLGSFMSRNHEVNQFAALGKKLLEEDNKPVIVTVDKFMPFVDLFRIDKKKIDPTNSEFDSEYKRYIGNLYKTAKEQLGMSPYRPMIVIKSLEDPQELAWFNRNFSQIHSDHVSGESARDKVPSAVSNASGTTVEDMILNSSFSDLVTANQSPEMIKYFQTLGAQSAILDAMFHVFNASPKTREEFKGSVNKNNVVEPSVDNSATVSPFDGAIIDDWDE